MAAVLWAAQPVDKKGTFDSRKYPFCRQTDANLGIKISVFLWCTRQESNLWPSESESDALSN